MPRGNWLSRPLPDSPTSYDRDTPSPHISPLAPRRRNGRRSPTLQAGSVERRPAGDGSLDPQEDGGSTGEVGVSVVFVAARLPECPHTNFKLKYPHKLQDKKSLTKFKAKYSTLTSAIQKVKKIKKINRKMDCRNSIRNRKTFQTKRNSLTNSNI